MSSAPLIRTAPEAAANTSARPTNPDLRLCNVPQIDQRLIWTEIIVDGVTGQHWVANLAYEPLRKMVNELPRDALIKHIDWRHAPAAPGVWQPLLPPALDPEMPAPVTHSTRAKRERPVSAVLEAGDPRRPPESKKPHLPTPAEEGERNDKPRETATPVVMSSADPKGDTGSSPRCESASVKQLFAEHQASLQDTSPAAASPSQESEAPEEASEGDLGEELEGLRSMSRSSVSSDPGLPLYKLLPAFRPSNVGVPPSHVASPERKIVRLKHETPARGRSSPSTCLPSDAASPLIFCSRPASEPSWMAKVQRGDTD
ncbi:hypothetical protein KEM55_006749 [Ascosphaera atra]|nr:hypothetical protein KEM55_006749 [Ascosphaera atra]